ncbi:rubrerythrin [miscellaneous Crenarchaeota group archaeon SMTZ-80]|nr:MAG: rubrerythrin [miscellaneous Crenarchaeota group archaeon SMTZ-80]
MKTDENLKAAFAGESQANRKYIAFSRKAEKEGYLQVAKLFRAAAEAETVHALNHFRVIGEISATSDNLKAAKKGEVYENTIMYPDFIKDAESESRKKAIITFTYANKVEKVHSQLYQKAIEAVQTGKDLEKTDYFVCQTCGYTVGKDAPEVCPVCGALQTQFKKTN